MWQTGSAKIKRVLGYSSFAKREHHSPFSLFVSSHVAPISFPTHHMFTAYIVKFY